LESSFGFNPCMSFWSRAVVKENKNNRVFWTVNCKAARQLYTFPAKHPMLTVYSCCL
jgi:hypothetical protein